MSDKIRVFISNNEKTKYSMLKFGQKIKEGINEIKYASIKSNKIIENIEENIKTNIENSSTLTKMNIRREKEDLKKLEKMKMFELSVEIKNKIKKYTCRKEGDILNNVSYMILKKINGGYILYPINQWYSLSNSINYHTLNIEEAEREFNKNDKIDSNYSIMKRKFNNDGTTDDIDDNIKKSNVKKENTITNDDDNDNEDNNELIDYCKDSDDENDEDKLDNDIMLNSKVKRLEDSSTSESESDNEENLTEQGKELKKLMDKLNNSDSSQEKDSTSNSDDDFDALEKKYGKSIIFTEKNELNFDASSKERNNKSSQNTTKLPPPSTKVMQSNTPSKTPSNIPPNTTSSGAKSIKSSESMPNINNQSKILSNNFDRLIEEKVKHYLSHKPMNTVILIKKLLAHAPSGITKEQIIFRTANVLKHLGIDKKVINGKTYIQLPKR